MADEYDDSNRPSLLRADQYITNQNLTGSESAFTASWGSTSSSFLNASFESELDSSETDNDDGYGDGDDVFIAELTRQMADYMLLEDDYDNNKNTSPEEGLVLQKPASQVKNKQNQHRVGQTQNSKRGRKGKMTESTQQMKSSKGEGVLPVVYGPAVGSGMRAIFLNGSGLKTGSSGTGVFFPRSATDARAQSRKKPGCLTALVPTRVLLALQQHFNNVESLSPSSNPVQIQPNPRGQRGDTQQNLQGQSTSTNHLERKLPQEWTY